MSERSDQILKTSGLPDPSLAALERGDALFVLTASTLLYHDESGTRRVTLRDLARIHSDQEGTLRVETPAGTALSASLVGFDPAEVQAFFRQVRDVTAQAKQLPASPVPGSPAPGAGAASAPSLAKPADPAPAQVPVAQPPVTQSPATQAAPAARPVVQLPEPPQTVTGPAFPAATARSGPSAAGAGTSSTPAAPDETTKPAGTPPPPPPRRQASASPAAQPAAGAQPQKSGGQKPPAPRPAAPQPSATPAPKSQPRVVASPSSPLPVPSGPAPAPAAPAAPTPASPAVAPASAASAEAPVVLASPVASARAELLAQVGAVAGLGGRLRLLAVILMLAALGLAYFLYTAATPQPLNALWVIIAGGVGAVALTVLASLTRLLATMAQVVGARENGDG